MNNYLIAGSSSGVGARLSETLSDSAHVWELSRTQPESSSEKWAQWDACRDDVPQDFLPEKLNGLIYCPGSIRLKPFANLTDSDFTEDFELNVLGAVRLIRQVLPNLRRSGNASIVLFSTVAVSSGMPMHSSIAAAKGAIEGLVRSLAAEFAPGIRVNAVAPSLTDTPLAKRLLRTDKQRSEAAARHPLERIGSAHDIAAAAAFLLSDHSSWITGHVLPVDGGLGRSPLD